MFAVTKANIHKNMLELLKEKNVRKVDFRQFSKIYKTKQKKYDFRIERLFELMDK